MVVDPEPTVEDAGASEEGLQPRARGRPAIPTQWVQVISLDHDEPLKMNLKELGTERLLAAAEARVPNTRRERTWEPVFCPRKFAKENNPLTMEGFRLTEAQLRAQAITISKLRGRMKKEAMQLAALEPEQVEGDLKEVAALGEVVRRRGHAKPSFDTPTSLPDFKEQVPVGSRQRRRRRGSLTLADKVDICHKVLVQFQHWKEVAKEHRVSLAVVSVLIKKAKKNPSFCEALHEKEVTKVLQRAQAADVIKGMISTDTFIDSAAQVQAELKSKAGLEYNQRQVQVMLRRDLGMSYKKVKGVAPHANSEKNRVLRQRFALELVTLLEKVKRILNVDETWLGMTDFRRMKWRARGSNNSVPHVQVAPRISMIVGLDTTGAVYLSLLQANNDSSTMDLFFKSLVKKLS